MTTVLILLVVLPAAMALLCLVLPRTAQWFGSILTGVISFGLAVALIPAVASGGVVAIGFLRVDALSLVFVLGTAFLYPVTAIYSVGYFAPRGSTDRRGRGSDPSMRRYLRRFTIGLNVFAWSMLCAPLVNGLALLWIAVEITTVVSALMVTLDDTDGAAEAAWKYVLIASSGLGIALLATIVMYYAGSIALGGSFDLAFEPLVQAAGRLPDTPVRLAFGLAVIGFGTKVGLFPVHTWLPDAHAEAPTPVSVLLSGALLATSLYAVLRFFQITVAAVGPRFPQTVMLVFGLLSLLLAALYLFEQQHLKRMLAYSSIEHMGILAIGVSFGAPAAFVGVLLHVLAHAAAKGAAFMGAGVFVAKFNTPLIERIHDAGRVLPWSGPLFLLAVLGLSALPPFGIFRSEFLIVSGGLAAGHDVAGAVLVILVTVAFFGLVVSLTRMVLAPGPAGAELPEPGEPHALMVVALMVAVLALALLGLHPPHELVGLLQAGAGQLEGSPR